MLEALLSHRSVRAFVPDALAPHTLVAAAQSGPTSSNLQTWRAIAVQLPERREPLAALTGPQAHVARAPLALA